MRLTKMSDIGQETCLPGFVPGLPGFKTVGAHLPATLRHACNHVGGLVLPGFRRGCRGCLQVHEKYRNAGVRGVAGVSREGERFLPNLPSLTEEKISSRRARQEAR